MTTIIDLDAIRQKKIRSMKPESLRMGFREYVTVSVPYWIVLVAVVLFGLSAS